MDKIKEVEKFFYDTFKVLENKLNLDCINNVMKFLPMEIQPTYYTTHYIHPPRADTEMTIISDELIQGRMVKCKRPHLILQNEKLYRGLCMGDIENIDKINYRDVEKAYLLYADTEHYNTLLFYDNNTDGCYVGMYILYVEDREFRLTTLFIKNVMRHLEMVYRLLDSMNILPKGRCFYTPVFKDTVNGIEVRLRLERKDKMENKTIYTTLIHVNSKTIERDTKESTRGIKR